jgi:hypothetical protein
MRKNFYLLALAMPTAAIAQSLGSIASANPFNAVSGVADALLSILNPISTTILVIALPLALFFAVVRGQPEKLFTLTMPAILIFGATKIMAFVFGSDVKESVAVDDKPGFFSTSWDWLVSHFLGLGVGLGLMGLTAFIVGRSLSKRADRLRVKMDVRDVLQTIDSADQLLLYWENTKPASDYTKKYALQTIEKLKAARSELLVLLKQAHNGIPFDERQRSEFSKIRNTVVVAMKDDVGIDVTPRLHEFQSSTTNKVPPAQEQVLPAAAQQLTAASVGGSSSFTDDLFNPLNPLSPISPWSVWNHHDDASSPRNSTSVSAPIVSSDDDLSNNVRGGASASWQNDDTKASECRYEPPSSDSSYSSNSDSCSSSDSGSSSSDSGSSSD